MKIKGLTFILFLLSCAYSFAQSAEDTTIYSKYPGIYGMRYPRVSMALNYPAAFATVDEMVNDSGTGTYAVVLDSLRGGLFFYYADGLKANNYSVFDAKGRSGGYWKRQVKDGIYLISWSGAHRDSSSRKNVQYIQNMINTVPDNSVISGDLTQQLLLDTSLTINRRGLYLKNLNAKHQLHVSSSPDDMIKINADSVTIDGVILDGNSANITEAGRFDAIIIGMHPDKINPSKYVTVKNSKFTHFRKNGVEIVSNLYGNITNCYFDSIYRDAVSMVKVGFTHASNITVENSQQGGGGEISDSSYDSDFRFFTVRNCQYAIDVDAHNPDDTCTNIAFSNIISDNNKSFLSPTSGMPDYTFNLAIQHCIISNGAGGEHGDIFLPKIIDGLILDDIIFIRPHNIFPRLEIQRARDARLSRLKFSGLHTGKLISIRTDGGALGWNSHLILDDISCDSFFSASTAAISIDNTTGVDISRINITGANFFNQYFIDITNASDCKIYNNTLTGSSNYAIHFEPSTVQNNISVHSNNFDGTKGTRFDGSAYRSYSYYDNSVGLNKQVADAGNEINYAPIITQTKIKGSNSGFVLFSQPVQGAFYKKVIIRLETLVGDATYTFPRPFINVPSVINSSGLPVEAVTSISTTTCTVTGSASTGNLYIEGY